jgi:indole-3-glycerol phosphate synthase
MPVLAGASAHQLGDIARAGAEGIVVPSVDVVTAVREHTDLPILVQASATSIEMLKQARRAGADAVRLVFEETSGNAQVLSALYTEAAKLDLDCPLDVRDERELAQALELIDPEILVLSERGREKDERDLDRTLALLADVPAGKLVISQGRVDTREQVLELEGAGVDALTVDERVASEAVADIVSALVGRA